jgi:2-C-methyl-D-erythritol 2,4-cyclodiphosphate synthase
MKAMTKINKPSFLIGQGKDIHNLTFVNKNHQFILAGRPFASKYKIDAHSDGDVVLHSICNAILGALCKGDIGIYFSDTNPKNKSISSTKIANFVITELKKSGYCINNIDLTITCEYVKISPIRKKIIKNLVKIFNCNFVNVKATRFETNIQQIQVDSIVLLALNCSTKSI